MADRRMATAAPARPLHHPVFDEREWRFYSRFSSRLTRRYESGEELRQPLRNDPFAVEPICSVQLRTLTSWERELGVRLEEIVAVSNKDVLLAQLIEPAEQRDRPFIPPPIRVSPEHWPIARADRADGETTYEHRLSRIESDVLDRIRYSLVETWAKEVADAAWPVRSSEQTENEAIVQGDNKE